MFKDLSEAVAKQIDAMKDDPWFEVALPKDELWDLYLASFPEGVNPFYKARTEHDCNCCKNFIRDIGGLVAICGTARVVHHRRIRRHFCTLNKEYFLWANWNAHGSRIRTAIGTLLQDLFSWIAVWEADRAVEQAREFDRTEVSTAGNGRRVGYPF